MYQHNVCVFSVDSVVGVGYRAVMETLCFVCWLVVGRVFMAVLFFGKGVKNRVWEYGMIVV